MDKRRDRRPPRNPDAPPGLASLCGHLADHCPLPLLITERDVHVVLYANPAFARLCGRPEQAVVGLPLSDALTGLAGAAHLVALLDRVYATGQAECAADIEHSDPSGRPAHWSAVVWPTPSEQDRPAGLVVQVADRTEAPAPPEASDDAAAGIREINQALMISSVQQHELAEAARLAEETIRETKEQDQDAAVLAERNRIAREIHDTLAQAFTGILLQLRVAQRIAEQRPGEAWELIERVGELAQEGLAEARRSVWALQPQAMEYGDLAGALSHTIDRIASSSPAEIEMHVHGTPRPLPPDVGVDLLRIGQEALTNALRHGQAHIIYVELTYAAERVLLRVQDDGLGFDVAHQADGGGFGLVGMAQRAQRLGGRLAIASQPGRGTEVAISVPLPAQEKRNRHR